MIIRICIIICMIIANFLFVFAPVRVLAEDQAATGMISMLGVGTNDKGYFAIEGNPGQKRSVTVNLKNASDKVSATALMFVADAPVATGGGMGTLPPDKAIRQDVGGWFKWTDQSVSLAPGESRDFVLNYEIPANASPGDHVGQVVLYKYISAVPEQKKLQANESKLYLNKAYIQAIAVQVKIPGIVAHRLILRSLMPHWVGSDAFLDLIVANEGNAIEQSKGTIIVSQNGKEFYTKDGELGSIYPGTSAAYSFPIPAELMKSGTYNTDVAWTYGGLLVNEKFNYTIKQEDVKNAERVMAANQEAQHGRTLSKQAIILQPEMLVKIGIVLFMVIFLIIVLLLWFRRKSTKASRSSPHLSQSENPKRSNKQKRSERPYPFPSSYVEK
jgi:hypothetical protein